MISDRENGRTSNSSALAERVMLVRVPVELHEIVRRTAFEERTSMSAIARKALTDYVRRCGALKRRR